MQPYSYPLPGTQDFLNMVADEVRGNTPGHVTAFLSQPDMLRVWRMALVAILDSCDSTIGLQAQRWAQALDMHRNSPNAAYILDPIREDTAIKSRRAEKFKLYVHRRLGQVNLMLSAIGAPDADLGSELWRQRYKALARAVNAALSTNCGPQAAAILLGALNEGKPLQEAA